MKRDTLIISFLIILINGASVEAATESASGKGNTATKPQAPQMQHRRGPKKLVLTSAEGASIKLWKPDLTTIDLNARMGVITIPSTGMDNYHTVVAVKEWGDLKEAVIRYEYLRGKPSGRNPRDLAAAQKTDFEIVPDPIPREHHRYYSDKEWDFIIRFRGKPVANLPVLLETANGSKIETVSDKNGMIRIHIPDDFPGVILGKRDRRTAELTLSAEYQADGIIYQTMLSAEYRLNPQHWRSLSLGIAVTALGMLAGGFLGRTTSGKGA